MEEMQLLQEDKPLSDTFCFRQKQNSQQKAPRAYSIFFVLFLSTHGVLIN